MPVYLITGTTGTTEGQQQQNNTTAETGSNITGQQQADPAQNRNRQKHETDIRQQAEKKNSRQQHNRKMFRCPVLCFSCPVLPCV